MNFSNAAKFLFLIFCLMGCAKNDQSRQSFLLPWPDNNGGQSLQWITIETLNSPYEISGPVAKMYFQGAMTMAGFTGDPVRPRLSVANGKFVPLDVFSSLGLTLYAHMERIQNLDMELGIADVLPWPRQVGYEILLEKSENGFLEYNNARYFLDADIVSFTPMQLGTTPLALNPGVIAHEHYHAHFNYRVMKGIPKPQSFQPEEVFNDEVLLRGWNEGLSDYYAFVYSKDAEFLTQSLGHNIGKARSLETQNPHQVSSASSHFKSFLEVLRNSKYSPGGLSYALGTDIARTLYWLVQFSGEGDPISSHHEMIKFVTNRISLISQYYVEHRSKGPIEPTAILELLFFKNMRVLSKSQCRVLADVAPAQFSTVEWEAQCL